jgi:hypothetical protein
MQQVLSSHIEWDPATATGQVSFLGMQMQLANACNTRASCNQLPAADQCKISKEPPQAADCTRTQRFLAYLRAELLLPLVLGKQPNDKGLARNHGT